MNRRTYLAGIGTVGVSAGGLFLAYQLSEGNISLGEEADVAETVSGTAESFEFEAAAGDDIFVTLTNRNDESRGAFALYDPDGTEVLARRITSAAMANGDHAVERGGTYRVQVDPRGSSVRVSVLVREPDE